MRSLLRELGMENCRSISTPLCATVEKEGHRSDRLEVRAELATKHRAAVARVVYLARDRLDVGERGGGGERWTFSSGMGFKNSDFIFFFFLVSSFCFPLCFSLFLFFVFNFVFSIFLIFLLKAVPPKGGEGRQHHAKGEREQRNTTQRRRPSGTTQQKRREK